MAVKSKYQMAEYVLSELSKVAEISVHDNPQWSAAGNRAIPLMLRLLASEGAIETDAKAGRWGGSVHRITDKGRWLLEQLHKRTLLDPNQWDDVEMVKWNLLLPNELFVLKGYKSHMLRDVERFVLTEIWAGDEQAQVYKQVLENYGSTEARLLLAYTTDIVGHADVSYTGDDLDTAVEQVRARMTEMSGLKATALTRIASIVLYKIMCGMAEDRV